MVSEMKTRPHRWPPPPPSRRGESDTLELRITVDKSILLYYTIYILFRVASGGSGNVEEDDNQRGEPESVIYDALIFLCVDFKFVNGRLADRDACQWMCPAPLSAERHFFV